MLVSLRWGGMKNYLFIVWPRTQIRYWPQAQKETVQSRESQCNWVYLPFFFLFTLSPLFLSLSPSSSVFLVTCAAIKLGVHLLGSIISVMPLVSLLTAAFYGWVSVAPLLRPCRLKWSLSFSNNQLPSFLSLSHFLALILSPSFSTRVSLPVCLSLYPFSPFPTSALVSLGTLFGRVAMSDIFPLLPSAIETGSLAVCLFPQLADLKMLHATHSYTHTYITGQYP